MGNHTWNIILIVLTVTMLVFTGCEDNDPAGPDPDPTATSTAAPPTPTPAPETRDGIWSGTITTASLDDQTEIIRFTVAGDTITHGTAEIWSNDDYTADGGGTYLFKIAFSGVIENDRMVCEGLSSTPPVFWFRFSLEGMFDGVTSSAGTWIFTGAVPTDADFDDFGYWDAGRE